VRWFQFFLTSTLGRKYLVGLTGIGLVVFAAMHLAGNLLMYAGPDAYNHYAEALHDNMLLPVAEVGLLVCFVTHIAFSLMLKARSVGARPQSYDKVGTKRGKAWYSPSKTMVITGVAVLGFVLLHLWDMRVPRLIGMGAENELEHTFSVLRRSLQGPVYLIGSLLLGIHVSHGFQSAFQSLGLKYPKYATLIERTGLVLALVVALGFASFPVYAFLIKGRG